MITNLVSAMVGNRQVLVWRGRSCFGHNLRMVDASHRKLADNIRGPVSGASWRRRVLRDRYRCCRQLYRVQHRNNFNVLVIQASIVSIDAHHTGDNEEQHIGCGGKENELTAATYVLLFVVAGVMSIYAYDAR